VRVEGISYEDMMNNNIHVETRLIELFEKQLGDVVVVLQRQINDLTLRLSDLEEVI